MSQDYKEINIRLKEIDNLGLFMLATKRILDSNCRELIEACTETMHSRVVKCQEEAIEIAKDIEVVDELSTMVVDIMVHDLTRRLEDQFCRPCAHASCTCRAHWIMWVSSNTYSSDLNCFDMLPYSQHTPSRL